MSTLSVWLHKVGDFLNAAVSAAPQDQRSALSEAASASVVAAKAAEAALPVLAKVIADAALAKVPGLGVYVPALNDFLDLLAAEILSRKTVAAPVAAPAQPASNT